MRTNIDIDDKLMRQTMAATGAATKKAAVEASMRLAVRLKAQEGIKKLFGKVVWRGLDDDWLAADEEITRKRRQSVRKTVSNEVPTAGKKLVSANLSGRR
jgi:Arc/MetJ family transcription regulator